MCIYLPNRHNFRIWPLSAPFYLKKITYFLDINKSLSWAFWRNCNKMKWKIKTLKFWKLVLLVKFISETIRDRGNPLTYICGRIEIVLTLKYSVPSEKFCTRLLTTLSKFLEWNKMFALKLNKIHASTTWNLHYWQAGVEFKQKLQLASRTSRYKKLTSPPDILLVRPSWGQLLKII